MTFLKIIILVIALTRCQSQRCSLQGNQIPLIALVTKMRTWRLTLSGNLNQTVMVQRHHGRLISVRPGTRRERESLLPRLWLSTAQRGSLHWRRQSSTSTDTCPWKIHFQPAKIILKYPPCYERELRKTLTKDISWKASVSFFWHPR